jgi:glycosyltransferase involved in cell wall biosynthesis
MVRLPFITNTVEGVVQSVLQWRQTNLSPITDGYDLVIPTAFPSYFISHPRKVTWLVAQYRFAYDLADTEYAAMGPSIDPALRGAIVEADKVALGESVFLYAISKNVAARLDRFNGLTAKVLYPASNGTPSLDRGIGDYVLCVGALHRLKRQWLLVQALAATRGSMSCIIAGEGHDREALSEQISQAGLGGRVVLAGKVSNEELRQLYVGARVVFYGPHDEDLGLVAMEASTHARPVITCSDSGGVLEFVCNGTTGWVVPPTVERIAEALDQAFEDDDLCRAMGLAASERISHLTWDVAVDRLTAET